MTKPQAPRLRPRAAHEPTPEQVEAAFLKFLQDVDGFFAAGRGSEAAPTRIHLLAGIRELSWAQVGALLGGGGLEFKPVGDELRLFVRVGRVNPDQDLEFRVLPGEVSTLQVRGRRAAGGTDGRVPLHLWSDADPSFHLWAEATVDTGEVGWMTVETFGRAAPPALRLSFESNAAAL